MQFSDIIGHQQLKTKLLSAIEEDRVPHAQMFLGPEGSGNLAMAFAFAQRLLCQNPLPNDSCGECSACRKADQMIHPDIHYSYPTIGSKAISTNFVKEWRAAIEANPYLNVHDWLQALGAENKQGNITKDECSNIIQKFSLKSFESDYKVLILWMPEYLAKEGNRLLKIIEEPPENTFFIFVANQAEKILGTILSRCQMIQVPRMRSEDITEALITEFKLDSSAAKSLAQVANGNYRQALKMADNRETETSSLFMNWMRKSWKGHGVEVAGVVDEIASLGRENQKHFLQYGLHFLRECLVIPWQEAQHSALLQEELATADKMRKVLDWEQINGIRKIMDECSYYVERNANPKIIFLDASLQLHQIFKAA